MQMRITRTRRGDSIQATQGFSRYAVGKKWHRRKMAGNGHIPTSKNFTPVVFKAY